MNVRLGTDCVLHDNILLGYEHREGCQPTILGHRAVIRWGAVIYADVSIGDDFKTGHFILIRENTTIGNRVVVGTHAVIDGHTEIGDDVKIETRAYIPTNTRIGSRVFIGPGAVLTNDKYPQRLRDEYEPRGPIIDDGVTIGANATIMPGVHLGEGALIAAGSVITIDVPPWTLARGVPARCEQLPERLREWNQAKNA